MKRHTVALLTALVVSSPAVADIQQIRIEVGGLWCGSCFYIAGKSMDRIAGVDVLAVILADQDMTAIYVVAYDDTVITPDAIAALPASNGFPARILPLAAAGSQGDS